MAYYKEMYNVLFNNVTKAITILQEAQRGTEEIYLSSDEATLNILQGNAEAATAEYPKVKT